MKNKLNKERVNIPAELALKIQAAIKITPGLDFNTLLIQALHHWFSPKQDTQQNISLADLKERYIKDSSAGYGPQGI